MRLYKFPSNVDLTSKKVKVISTFYAKRGPPHTTPESARNEVDYCTRTDRNGVLVCMCGQSTSYAHT